MKHILNWIEQGLLPDWVVRMGIRHLLKVRLKEEQAHAIESSHERYQAFLDEVADSPVAMATDEANAQHYEIPASFYSLVLGQHKKYSSCLYQGNETLTEAEHQMLTLYLSRAQLKNGQSILELGCGWGSLTLFMAETFSDARITAVSNSASQKAYIMEQARLRSLNNIQVITCDINVFSPSQQYDRVVSVEMFEHVRNYQQLFLRINDWLKPEGKLFFHVFCHRFLMYPFDTEGDDNWMGKYFFTGGQMPAFDTFLHFQGPLQPQRRWVVNGQHYEKTSNHWLENMDKNKAEIMTLFQTIYGEDARLWFQRWRIFFMSCAELFGYQQGQQWHVAHHLYTKPKSHIEDQMAA